MSKLANEKNLKQKLEYLNLDLDKIPEFLEIYQPLDYRVSNIGEEREQIYRYVPINKIQILITPNTKNSDLRKRYNDSLPLYRYLQLEKGEEVERYAIFLNMLKNMSIDEIEQIDAEQEKFNAGIPFIIKYTKSYLWQIYYAKATDTYFMLMPTEDMEYNYLFYLLKKQIEFYNSDSKVPPKIYVPISHLEYSRERLSKTDIKDIENYLWLFTGEWAHTYEVFDKKNNPSIQIIGECKVYDGIKTQYKIKLSTKEEAINFYKEIKALFILKTELSQYYKFDVRINKDSMLEFYYNSEPLSLEILPQFIKKEYQKISEELIGRNKTAAQLEQILQNMKIEATEKEREFLEKERQISTFLEYKKTFLGKIKIFFGSKKSKKEQAPKVETKKEVEAPVEENLDHIIQKKDTYTIEDLVTVYSVYDKKQKFIKNLQLDIDALEHKIKNLERKIKNAAIYIEEIEQHKKSIFEFWKFANKDELPALVQGEEVHEQTKKLRKNFSFELDFEELGNKLDKYQRENFSKEEINSVFIAQTDLLEAINANKKQEPDNADKKIIKKALQNLKEELNTEVIGDIDYDIFGAMSDDTTKIKAIANKHHREVEKSKLQIMKTTKKQTIAEFEEELNQISANIEEAMQKSKLPYDMSLFKVSKEELIPENIDIFEIESVSSMNKNSLLNEKEVNLYRLNLKEGMPVVFYTNIMFYENYNKTLPVGMDLSKSVLIDLSKYHLTLKTRTSFKTNLYSGNDEDSTKLDVKQVNVYEYDVKTY